ncbi:MAG: GPR endopeptidase [Lachnospiraceae bacterium]
MQFEIRTDLAVERKEEFEDKAKKISGVSLKEWYQEESQMKLTKVEILDETGERAMGKEKGTYMTLEAPQMAKKDEDYHRQVSEELGRQLKKMAVHALGHPPCRILAAGLGNPSVTPDSLGPRVLGNLCVTRHMEQEYGKGFLEKHKLISLSAVTPGVMAQTGMETAEIIRGVVKETKPDLMIVIDALAARSVHRLGCTIQLADTGIRPGSGVGNHRCELTKKSLGIPVLAIGVPTVVGAAAIVFDTIQALIQALQSEKSTKGMGDYLDGRNGEEQYALIRELLEPEFGPLYVTPPDIDETVKELSFTISEGIHRAFLPNMEFRR